MSEWADRYRFLSSESSAAPGKWYTDQRKYYVPCPQCGEYQALKWSQVQWEEGQPETAAYICEHNGCILTDADKPRMLKQGEWRAGSAFKGTAGFFINELYSPWVTFAAMAQNFLEAKKLPETLKTFTNTSLAETWDNDYAGEGIDEHFLMQRAEDYGSAMPDGVLLITCGVDVQDDRIEGEIVGWGMDEESWSLDYFVIHGNPQLKAVWQDLDDRLCSVFTNGAGVRLSITAACIDTGGHHTEQVYQYCKASQHKRIFGVKGQSQSGKPIVGNPTRNNPYRVKLFPLGVDTAKEAIYGRLKITTLGAGYCHFPLHYEAEYFAQLTAEKFVTRFHQGRTRREWIKTRQRNEALDCRVYALAALKILKPNWLRLEARMKELAAKAQATSIATGKQEPKAIAQDIVLVSPPMRKHPVHPHRRGNSFANRWKSM